MGLDEDKPLNQLKDRVLLKVCSSIDKFGWDKFQQHIPSNWSCNRDDLKYDTLRKLDVPVKDFLDLLYELQLKEAMSYLVTFIPVFIREDLPKDIKVETGEALKLEFKAEGMPSPIFKWYRRAPGENEMSLIKGQTSSVLCIPNFQATDVGVYACRATNVGDNGEKASVESNNVIAIELTENSDDGEKPDKKPVIIRQPVGESKLYIGASFILEVLAKGEEPLSFKWFKNGVPLEGATESKLELRTIMPDLEERSWKYACLVSNEHDTVLSDPVVVGLAKKNSLTCYQAEDKVALLICNVNYLLLHSLESTLEDVTTLSNQLKRENFKVIALRDLDLVEMKNAVKYFCSLLDRGVYGFFYYAGHGFEYNNQRYMQPINSLNNDSIDDSLCAEYVHAEMEKRKPRLAALIFDMCRVEREQTKSVVGQQIIYKAGSHPNFIIAFATLFQKRAYGIQGVKNGVFVFHLKKYINNKISIQTVMNNVITEVNADPAAGTLQHPALHHSLPESYSLTDPIVITDLKAAKARERLFQQITVCPNGMKGLWPLFSEIALSMSVSPHRGCILNALDVVVRIVNPCSGLKLVPIVQVENATVDKKRSVLDAEEMTITGSSEKQNVLAVREISPAAITVKENETACGVSVFNLQRFKEKILASLSLCYADRAVPPHSEMGLDLGMPFIMGIDLLQSHDRSKPVEACEGVIV